MASLTFLLFTTLNILPYVQAGPPYCLPGQSCYPSASAFATFNASIGGRLLAPPPYGNVCYKQAWDAAACENLIKSKSDIFFRAALPSGVMYTNWEQDEAGKGCVVPDDVPSAPLAGECTLGALAPYVVKATGADDISKAVKFAASHNLRLRVKNSGHDYTGRSTGAGSLTIWTVNLKNANLVKNFTPAGCASAYGDVIAADPGVDVVELYTAGNKFNVTTIGGYTPSVGAAGGYIVGGGTGPLSPTYGFGVDNVAQFDVVLADGTQTSANACKNQDLFWAMRGGGGVFAVHTKVYIKARPAFSAVTTIHGVFTVNDKTAYAAVVKKLVNLQPTVSAKGLNGIWETSYPNIAYLNVLPFLPGQNVISPAETFKLFADVVATPGQTNNLQALQWSTWQDAYTNVVIPMVKPGGVVGVNLADFSRIISNDLVSTQAGLDKISNFILNLPEGEAFIYQLAAGRVTNIPNPTDTPINPAWRSAFAFFNVPTFGPYTGLTSTQNATWQTVRQEAEAVFGINAYYNEEFAGDTDWAKSYWGSNYDRLVKIKKAVDPTGVFSCRQCVNSEAGF